MGQIRSLGYVMPGKITHGFWCDTCLLPSMVEVEVVLLSPAGVSSGIGSCRFCTDCDEWRPSPVHGED